MPIRPSHPVPSHAISSHSIPSHPASPSIHPSCRPSVRPRADIRAPTPPSTERPDPLSVSALGSLPPSVSLPPTTLFVPIAPCAASVHRYPFNMAKLLPSLPALSPSRGAKEGRRTGLKSKKRNPGERGETKRSLKKRLVVSKRSEAKPIGGIYICWYRYRW